MLTESASFDDLNPDFRAKAFPKPFPVWELYNTHNVYYVKYVYVLFLQLWVAANDFNPTLFNS